MKETNGVHENSNNNNNNNISSKINLGTQFVYSIKWSRIDISKRNNRSIGHRSQLIEFKKKIKIKPLIYIALNLTTLLYKRSAWSIVNFHDNHI